MRFHEWQEPGGQGSAVSILRVGSTLLRGNILLDLEVATFDFYVIHTDIYKPECWSRVSDKTKKAEKFTRTLYLIRTLTKRCLPLFFSIPIPSLWWQKALFFNTAEISERAKFNFWLFYFLCQQLESRAFPDDLWFIFNSFFPSGNLDIFLCKCSRSTCFIF